jgi:ribosomal protein S18 acetylase RimI-like enzyme
VGTLSNFLRRASATGPAGPGRSAAIDYRPAGQQQIHPALRIILGANGRAADEGVVVDFLQFAIHRAVELNDTWVAADHNGRVVWAVLPMVSAGRTMLLLAPGGRPRHEGGADVAGTLVDAVCEHFAARGIQLAQALTDPTDGVARELFLAHSFSEVAELLYLQADLRRLVPPPSVPDGFDWLTYSPDSHDAFARTIVQTYRDSLDCPALNGLREIEDVIAGHKASGGGAKSFDPAWWFLLRERGEPLAVLLLARTAAPHAAAELVYLGLVPAARGRGIGDILMRQAQHAVSGDGGGGGASVGGTVASLALAVDAHNPRALRLYHRHGMRRVGSKRALVRQLRVAREAPGVVVHEPSTRPINS